MTQPRSPGQAVSYGLWRPDPHISAKISDTSLELYKSAGLNFVRYLYGARANPDLAPDWDMWLIEWKNDPEEKVTKAQFSYTIASVEHFFPMFKGSLPLARAALTGWETLHATRHTVPMGKSPASLVALHFIADGRPRLAAGLLLQVNKGTRPTEMLNIRTTDVVFPDVSTEGNIVIRLGTRIGTKAKREQFIVIRQRTSTAHQIARRCHCTNSTRGKTFPLLHRSVQESSKEGRAFTRSRTGVDTTVT